MDAATEARVRTVWTRLLGLADDVLDGPARQVAVTSDDVVMTVRLWDHEVVCAPAAVLPRALELAGRSRLTADVMVSLAGPRGRLVGRADLGYTTLPAAPGRRLAMTDDVAAARELEDACRPEEVAEAGLSDMEHLCVGLDREQRPVAGAGYQVQAGMLAQVGVLIAPRRRREGLGRSVAAAAVNHAVGRGLVAQWRSRTGHDASAGLGARLGFETVGQQVTVVMDPR